MTTRPPISRERALAHDSRVALLSALQDAGEALDAAQLADVVGLHVNTVRSHLGMLQRAGLVQRRPEVRTHPGRPRQLYSATAGRAADGGGAGPDRHRLMARMLASYIATNVGDPAAAAEETGRQWGRHMTPPPPPFAVVSADEARAALLRVLDDIGFAPRVGADPDEIELRHCPFREVAEAHPEVACSLHLGLMRGAMAALDAPLLVEDLIPFVDPHRCLTHVRDVTA